MDLVSVIIPCYNVSRFVKKLSWIFEQTYPELELVLIDDCSTDKTWPRLKAFKRQHADKRIILAQNTQNEGAGETRNHGLTLSSGKYVCFWDADDKAYPFFVERMLAKIQQENADFVFCAHDRLDVEGKVTSWYIVDNLIAAQNDINSLKQQVFDFYVTPWTKMVRRDFIQEHDIRFAPLSIGDDNCWTLQLVLNAKKIAFLNEPCYQYYIGNPLSSTNHRSDLWVKSFYYVVPFYLDYINKLGLAPLLYDKWKTYFVSSALETLKHVPDEQREKFLRDVVAYGKQHQIELGLKFSGVVKI